MLKRTRSEANGFPPKGHVPVVGIGGGRGATKALRQLLTALPAETGKGFVYVPTDQFDRQLTTLATSTSMPVVKLSVPAPVRADHVYLAPPNSNLELRNGVLYISRTSSADMPIDRFLKSLAEDQHAAATAVLLSGAACDGLFGLDAIKANGGITFVQQPDSAESDGMPRMGIATGSADFILPPKEIANEIVRMVRSRSHMPLETGIRTSQEERHWLRLFKRLRNVAGIDFTHYRKPTLERRLAHRMSVQHFQDLGKYIEYVEEDKDQAARLAKDFLVTTTGFFREPSGFDALQRCAFPLWRARSAFDPIRVWVAGCSSGAEAYSIGMLLRESLDCSETRVQIFATDVSEPELEKARSGTYSANLLATIPSSRLHRFFRLVNGKFHVIPDLREMCVFARHDLIKDPPFPHIDLVSCRNVLIYLEPVLQKKVLEKIHYALKPDGFLLLGKSEEAGANSDLFTPVEWKNKLFRKTR